MYLKLILRSEIGTLQQIRSEFRANLGEASDIGRRGKGDRRPPQEEEEAGVGGGGGEVGVSLIFTEAGVKSQPSIKIDERWKQIQASISTVRFGLRPGPIYFFQLLRID